MLNRRSASTGIDVGTRSVKLVRVDEGPKGSRVTHWGHEEIFTEEADRSRAASQALNRLLSRLRLSRRSLGRVAVAIGSPDVILRQVNLPPLSEADLRRSLPFEARKHLPLENMPDAVLDFQVLGPARATNGSDAEGVAVLLVAAPRKAKDELLRILNGAGIEPDVIDVEPLPALNALLATRGASDHPEQPMALMDLGGLSRTLAVALPDGEIYIRNLKVPERVLSEENDADVGDLIRETGDTLRFLNVRRRDQSIGELHLCGGSSLSEWLKTKLSTALGVDVKAPDPFLGLELASSATPAPAEKVCMVSAVGLALWWQDA